MRNRVTKYRVLALAVPLLLILARTGAVTPIPPLIMATLVGAALVLVPGLAFGLVVARVDGPAALAFASALGLGYWAILGLAYFYLGVPLEYVAWVGTLAASAWMFFRAGPTTDARAALTAHELVVLIGVTSIFGAISFAAARFHPVYFDTYFHLAGVRQILTSATYVAEDPFLAGGVPAQSPYVADSWYLVSALTAWFARTTPDVVYVAMACLVAAGSVLVVFTLARALLEETAGALWVAVIYVFYMAVIYTAIIATVLPTMYMAFAPYPGEVLRFLTYPMLLLLVIYDLEPGSKVKPAALAVITIALATTHAQYLLYLAIALISLAVFVVLKPPRLARLRDLVVRTLPISVSALACAVLRARSNAQVAGHWYSLPFDSNPTVVQHDYLVITPNLYLINPTAIFGTWVVVMYIAGWIGALILARSAWRGSTRRVAAAFLALTLVPLVIMYDPLVVPLLVRAVTWVLPRRLDFFPNLFFFLVPAAALLTASLGWLAQQLRMRVVPGQILFGALLLGCAIYAPLREPFTVSVAARAGALDITTLADSPVIAYLAAQGGRAVVCADADTSYLIGAYTTHRVVAIHETRMGASDDEIQARIRDNAALLSGGLPSDDFAQLARRYGVAYVVVPASQVASFAKLGDEAGQRVLESAGSVIWRLNAQP